MYPNGISSLPLSDRTELFTIPGAPQFTQHLTCLAEDASGVSTATEAGLSRDTRFFIPNLYSSESAAAEEESLEAIDTESPPFTELLSLPEHKRLVKVRI